MLRFLNVILLHLLRDALCNDPEVFLIRFGQLFGVDCPNLLDIGNEISLQLIGTVDLIRIAAVVDRHKRDILVHKGLIVVQEFPDLAGSSLGCRSSSRLTVFLLLNACLKTLGGTVDRRDHRAVVGDMHVGILLIQAETLLIHVLPLP